MENYEQRNSVSSIAQKEEMFRVLAEGHYREAGVDYGGVLIAGETEGKANIVGETERPKDKGVYVGTEDDESDELSDTDSDGLGDIWDEMTVALECSKDATEDALLNDAEDETDCQHSFILKDDVGEVCSICGVIKRRIETIIDYNFSKDCSFLQCKAYTSLF